MKKFVLLLSVLFAFQILVHAQDPDIETILFNVHLIATLNLNIEDDPIQTITFDSPDRYNFGTWQGAGIAPGFNTINVESTGNWNLTIEAPDFTPANPNTIPIENLGLWIEAIGTHEFGVELTSPCQNVAATLGITSSPQEIIGLFGGGFNGGDMTDNRFIFNWRMGTQDNATMFVGSMFSQVANGDFGMGSYSTIATLTLTAIP